MLFLTRCKRSLRVVTLLLMCFVVLTPLAGSRLFVTSALQRAESCARVVVPDQNIAPVLGAARDGRHAATALAAHHVNSLNLFLHLSGIFVPTISTDWLARPTSGTLAIAVTALPEWLLVFAIFEPPRLPLSSH